MTSSAANNGSDQNDVSRDRLATWTRMLHVSVLCGFAITEPTLAALLRQTTYRHDQAIGWIEVGVLLFALCVCLPVVAILLDRMMLRLSRHFSGRGRNAVLGLLGCLTLLSLLRPTARIEWMANTRTAWMLSLSLSVPGAWLFARSYGRLAVLRFWLSVASIGMVVFPGSFIWQFASEQQRMHDEAARRKVEIQNPIPVVMIVFDEFSGTSLLNENLEIDAVHYPNFARLAAQSTWYRQATTVHSRTDFAVPAILSGRFPDQQRGPTEANHPGNLLQLIYNTDAYDMAVFESITRLCPDEMGRTHPGKSAPLVQRISDFLYTLATVYPRLLFPGDTPIEFPAIPKPWFGTAEELSDSLRQSRTTGQFRYQPGLERDIQLEHLLGCLRNTDRPLFCFFHTLLPHVPWSYFPSGVDYMPESVVSFSPDGGLGDLGETWPADAAVVLRSEHRYLLQAQFTDRFVGQILDKLEQSGLLDRCLLVVMSDHGVSFRPSRSRRVPDAENITDILSVPLFIKRPGQTTGKIDDGNVESIDVLPTVAEELGITLTEPIDGVTVTEPHRRPRKTLYFETGMTVVEPKIPHLEAAVRRRLTAFGVGSWDKPPRATASRPDWHGRAVATFPISTLPESQQPELELISPNRTLSDDGDTEMLVAGFVYPKRRQDSSCEIVLAIGGVIHDSCRTFAEKGGGEGFSFLIPEVFATQAPIDIELFLVQAGRAEPPQLVSLRKWTLARPIPIPAN